MAMKTTTRLISLASAFAFALVATASAAGYACYEAACDWDRTLEEELVQGATLEGGAHIEPGAPLAAPLQELLEEGYLRIVKDVEAHGRSWDLLVEIDYRCQAVAVIAGLSVPGYESLVPAINGTLPGLNESAAGDLEVRLCGTLYAGFEAGSDATTAGGQLRFQTGRDATLVTDLGAGHPEFPFWAGIVLTNTLDLARAPGDELTIVLALQAHAFFEGDLGWGSGTVDIALFDAPWRRVITATPLPADAMALPSSVADAVPAGCHAGEVQPPVPGGGTHDATLCTETGSGVDATVAASHSSYALRDALDEGTNGWSGYEQYAPAQKCQSTVPHALCQSLVSHPAALPSLATSRLADAYHGDTRFNDTNDTASVLVASCTDTAVAHCGTAGAELFVAGTLLQGDVATMSQPEHLNKRAGQLHEDLRLGALQDDVHAWIVGIPPEEGGP